MARNARDAVLEILAESELALKEHVVELEGHVAAWRAMTLAALELLHDQRTELARLQTRVYRLLDERRRTAA